MTDRPCDHVPQIKTGGGSKRGAGGRSGGRRAPSPYSKRPSDESRRDSDSNSPSREPPRRDHQPGTSWNSLARAHEELARLNSAGLIHATPVDISQVTLSDQEYLDWIEIRAGGGPGILPDDPAIPREITRRKRELCALRYHSNLRDIKELNALHVKTIEAWQYYKRKEEEYRNKATAEKAFSEYYNGLLQLDRPFHVVLPAGEITRDWPLPPRPSNIGPAYQQSDIFTRQQAQPTSPTVRPSSSKPAAAPAKPARPKPSGNKAPERRVVVTPSTSTPVAGSAQPGAQGEAQASGFVEPQPPANVRNNRQYRAWKKKLCDEARAKGLPEPIPKHPQSLLNESLEAAKRSGEDRGKKRKDPPTSKQYRDQPKTSGKGKQLKTSANTIPLGKKPVPQKAPGISPLVDPPASGSGNGTHPPPPPPQAPGTSPLLKESTFQSGTATEPIEVEAPGKTTEESTQPSQEELAAIRAREEE